jgi:hypothetical protein
MNGHFCFEDKGLMARERARSHTFQQKEQSNTALAICISNSQGMQWPWTDERDGQERTKKQ